MNPADSLDTEYACEVLAVHALDARTRHAMAALYCATYAAATPEIFFHDLSQKDEVLLLVWRGRLVGFTTLQTYSRRWGGRPLRVLFSGDTVVQREHWGQQALSFAWVRHLGVLAARFPGERHVWFLLVKGHRTYRYLHVFARSFHPGQAPEGSDLGELCQWLARDRFPDDYNPATGVVEFARSRGHLNSELAEPRADELARPGVAYFLARNPGFRVGHELACVCDIAQDNMKPLTLRLFRQGLHAGRAC
ncbi:MAG TPA: hypothetical protein VNB23_09415 [Ramlibacter sp.]|nr:hypothetical protein [Ramlibacter sp.]